MNDEVGTMNDEPQGARPGTAFGPSFIVHRSAFTLIEMLTTVAVLVIVLGLMVSLARYVRDRSAQQLTRQTLRDLETLMAQYAEHNAGNVPAVEPILPPLSSATTLPVNIDEATLAEAARRNNQQYVAALKRDYLKRHARLPLAAPAHGSDTTGSPAGENSFDPFEQLQMPLSVYDHHTLRDAWGSPIVFMPGQHALIGLAPSLGGKDQYFFFSAGPDHKYLTRDDNLYSYEGAGAQRR
jgi:prepilin-type N-terminal cleavage/methylation domain-containing protein